MLKNKWIYFTLTHLEVELGKFAWVVLSFQAKILDTP